MAYKDCKQSPYWNMPRVGLPEWWSSFNVIQPNSAQLEPVWSSSTSYVEMASYGLYYRHSPRAYSETSSAKT